MGHYSASETGPEWQPGICQDVNCRQWTIMLAQHNLSPFSNSKYNSGTYYMPCIPLSALCVMSYLTNEISIIIIPILHLRKPRLKQV